MTPWPCSAPKQAETPTTANSPTSSGELSTRSENFRVLWAAHDVRIYSTGIKKLHHPLVGDLDLPYESLPIELGSTTSLVTYRAEPGSPSQDALALLARWEASASTSRDSVGSTEP